MAWCLPLQGPTHRTNESTVYQLADSANIARLQQQMLEEPRSVAWSPCRQCLETSRRQ
jgi:hypothetical protein